MGKLSLALLFAAVIFVAVQAEKDLKTEAEWAAVDELRDCVHEYDQVKKTADESKFVDEDTERKIALDVFTQRFECIDMYKDLTDNNQVTGSRRDEVEDLGYQLYDTEEQLHDMWKAFQDLKKYVDKHQKE